jgi:hypothetical protein
VRLFALIFGLLLATVQVLFIDAYLRWLGAGWPIPPIVAVLLVGLPVVAELYRDEIQSRFPALAPLLAQTRSTLWQLINAILVFSGALLGFGWEWWQAGLLLGAILLAPHLAAAFIRRMG